MKSLLDDSQMLAVTGDCTLSKRFLEFVVLKRNARPIFNSDLGISLKPIKPQNIFLFKSP